MEQREVVSTNIYVKLGKTIDNLVAQHGSENLLNLLSCYSTKNDDSIGLIVDYINKKTAQHFGISELDLLTSTLFEVAYYRHVIWYVLVTNKVCNLPIIAKYYKTTKATASRSINYIRGVRDNKKVHFVINNNVDAINMYLVEYLDVLNKINISKNGK